MKNPGHRINVQGLNALVARIFNDKFNEIAANQVSGVSSGYKQQERAMNHMLLTT